MEKFMENLIHVKDSEFEAKVLASALPVIVDFWAPWCGPCRMIAPVLEEVAQERGGELTVAKVNTDDNPEWAMRFGVQGIPTLLFVARGEVIDRQVGAGPAPALKARIAAFLEKVNGEDIQVPTEQEL
jgi:thioredoxin 1